MNINELLPRWRAIKGWSQRDLARETGFARNSIGRYERGDTSPSTRILGELAKAFGVSVAAFLAGPGVKSAPESNVLFEPPGKVVVAMLSVFKGLPERKWGRPNEVRAVVGMDLDPTRHVLVTLTDDSMYPDLWAGDVVLVDVTQVELLEGKIQIVSADGKTALGRFFKVAGRPMLRFANPAYRELALPADAEVLGTFITGIQVNR